MQNLSSNNEVKILLPDGDLEYQQVAMQRGFAPTIQRRFSARIDIGNHAYALPNGLNY